MYDVKCEALARAFLEQPDDCASDANTDALAQAIQDAIEDWLWDLAERRADAASPGIPEARKVAATGTTAVPVTEKNRGAQIV